MKKIIAIIVLSSFLAHWVGVYLFFFVKLQAIRMEMKAQIKALPENELTRLELSEAEFQAAQEDEQEVKIDGKMYDIARVEYRDGRVVVFALHDEAEDNLLSFLDEITKRSMKDKARATTTLIQFASLVFLMPAYSTAPITICDLSESTTLYQFSRHSCVRSIESPPPKVASLS